jgi:hypothetical protein
MLYTLDSRISFILKKNHYCSSQKKKIMVEGEIRAAVKGLRRATETRNARAETLGSDGGQQTRKPVPGGAVGLAGTEKSTQDLFRVPMVRAEGEAGTGRGGDRDRGAAVGTPGGGALRAAGTAPGAAKRPDPAAAAGGRAVGGPASVGTWQGADAEGAYAGGTCGGSQDLIQGARPPADTPTRGAVPGRRPDDTSKHPIRPAMTYCVPRQMHEKLDQKPAADPTALSPEPPVQETNPTEFNINVAGAGKVPGPLASVYK